MRACSLVFNPPLVRPIRRPRWSSGRLFRPQARSRAVRLRVSRVDHDGLLLGAFRRQPRHHPGEDPHVTSPLPSVAERLRRAILTRRIAPPQAIAIDEDHPAQNTPIINPRLVGSSERTGSAVPSARPSATIECSSASHQFGGWNHTATAPSSKSMGHEPRTWSRLYAEADLAPCCPAKCSALLSFPCPAKPGGRVLWVDGDPRRGADHRGGATGCEG